MIFKIILILFILFIVKQFMINYNYRDYFNVTSSIILILFIYLFLIYGGVGLIFIIIILSTSICIYSYFNSNYIDDSIIIINGNIVFNNLIKNKYSLVKLFKDLKENNILFISNNICGVLHNNKLCIYKKRDNNPICVILKGNICPNELLLIGKSKKWIDNILINNNCSINDVIFSFYYNNKIYIIKK